MQSGLPMLNRSRDRKSTRLNSSHTVIYTLSLHDALPIWAPTNADAYVALSVVLVQPRAGGDNAKRFADAESFARSEEHTSELQSHSDLHSFPTRRSSDLGANER